MRRVVALLAALALVGVAGCASTPVDSSFPTTTVAAATRPFGVETWNETFVDRSRPTEAGAQTPSSPERVLETTIYLPDAPGPRPIVVFSHGLSGHPDKFTQLLSAWARAGYVVAAPAFPTTNSEVPGSSSNYNVAFGQPADVSFVLDEVLRLSADPASRLHGRIDADRIGAGGLSLGGGTTYSVTFSTCCRDDRIKAAEVLAGALFPLAGEMELDGHVPLLVVHGDKDPALRYQLAEEVFARAAPPVWFVTLFGGSHAPPFENDVTPHDAMVEQLTTDFWDATIGGDPEAMARFERESVVEGLSSLQAKP